MAKQVYRQGGSTVTLISDNPSPHVQRPRNTGETTFDHLAPDVLRHVLVHLDAPDVAQAGKTCRAFREIVQGDDQLWGVMAANRGYRNPPGDYPGAGQFPPPPAGKRWFSEQGDYPIGSGTWKRYVQTKSAEGPELTASFWALRTCGFANGRAFSVGKSKSTKANLTR